MYAGEALFCHGHVSSYLDGERNALRDAVNARVDRANPNESEHSQIERIVQDALVAPLVIHFDQVKKAVRPARVSVFDFGREIEIDGVQATRSYPFEGERILFALRPSTSTSVVPYGTLSDNFVTIRVEGRNDREKLKRDLDQQEKLLREYVGWINADVQGHNNALPGRVAQLVSARRKYLTSVAELGDGI